MCAAFSIFVVKQLASVSIKVKFDHIVKMFFMQRKLKSLVLNKKKRCKKL